MTKAAITGIIYTGFPAMQYCIADGIAMILSGFYKTYPGRIYVSFKLF